VARPLVEMAARGNLPVLIDVLRPPTFDRLREHLRQHPGRYHLLHFDGHGVYGSPAVPGAEILPYRLRGTEGQLVFETEDGRPYPIDAARLNAVLRESFGTRTFADAVMPLSIVATDLMAGEKVVLTSGSVFDAIRASIAMPLILRP